MGSKDIAYIAFPEGCSWCRNFHGKTKLRGKLSTCAYTELKRHYDLFKTIPVTNDLRELCGKYLGQTSPTFQAWFDIIIFKGDVPETNVEKDYVEMTSAQFAKLLEYEIHRFSSVLGALKLLRLRLNI